ncbi:MAG: hypothetical protein JWO81_2245 [Alphaproteobacteria bacterium]|nr:hypothetical protein [Alphaproteobacteria bacterium]
MPPFFRDKSGFEPAIFVALAARVWQAAAGLGTLFFVVRYFNPVEQGYYQTFLSLLAMQSFVELGILNVIVVVVSHEWAGLERRRGGIIHGDAAKQARLAAAARFIALWFVGAALLLFVIGGGIGSLVLAQHGERGIWQHPWLATITLAALALWCQGLVGLLEGCNQVAQVATLRLVQSVTSILVFWVALSSGAGLWSLSAQLAGQLTCSLVFVFLIYRRTILQLLFDRAPSDFDWRKDVWPMQWQLALQGVAGYFMFSFFVPVIYSYWGPVEAGRMGISLQVVIALLGSASAWLTVKTPRLGVMFASGRYAEYERTWIKTSALSMLLLLAGSAVAVGADWLIHRQGLALATRFLPPLPFTFLVAWTVMLYVMQCSATYWRAQRIELLGFWGLVPGAITGIAVWLLGQRYGALGETAGAFCVSAGVIAPLCLHFLRQAHRRIRALSAAA